MSTLTVPLPEEDLKFLRSYASAQGISAEALVARQARTLREQLQRPLPAAVSEATGIIAPASGRQEHLAHLEKKHA
jgi:hypothetical protein